MDKKKFGWRNWLSVILVGLAGQLAWAIENNYINLWVYSQTNDYKAITWMTMASAVVATITTFFMGALSDRLGKRKIFIAGGYIIWGVTVFLFGVMSLGNMMNWFTVGLENALILTGVMNVIVDCVMTFFGSTSNDACFNAYVTDATNEHNRPFVESVLSIMPLLAMGAMLGIGGAIGVPGKMAAGESATDYANRISSNWMIFFLVFGIITTLVGVVCLFIMPKDTIAPNRDEPYMKNLIYGFRPSTVKKYPLFYIALLAFMFFNIAVDSFMPYYLVYFTNAADKGGLGLADNYLPIMIIIMGVSSLVVVVLGIFMDKIGKLKLLFPAIGALAAGALMLFLLKDTTLVTIGGVIMMIGYLTGTAVLGACLRDQTPESEVGLFQGVRMVGAVMLPMVIGSNISPIFFTATYLNDLGQETAAPDHTMFLVAAIAALIAIAPCIWLFIKSKKKAEVAE